MMLGHPSPDPPWLQLAKAAILYLHIGSGTLGIVSGAVAMGARKGGRWHRWSGNTFFVCMLCMSAIGAAVSPYLPQRANVVPGLFVFYLTFTAWATVRLRDRSARSLETVGLFAAVATSALGVAYGLTAVASPGGLLDAEPSDTYFGFALFPAFAAMLDLTVICRRGVSGAARVARHLWRMSMALLIACGSLFLGQPKVFPPGLRGSPIMDAPELAVLALMAFWLIRVRFPGAPGRRVSPLATADLGRPRLAS